ncbi:hypothetical protein QAD02_006375 [Eretmocerus hayati]|uniref:Uncharacterized protein n=1 Tax=Eretmocerus hayati TaxID=131215 RepID=A0ACC2N1T6_9HYME|nr:hypothetical protein QAD02_006375 [Eretmocerus hayati]
MATMLAAKFVKRHGITREKWKTREKISQYRAILKLHARDKKLQTKNAIKLKKKVSKNLKDLQGDILEYRKIVKDVVTGDKRLLRASLQSNKDFQILLQDADPTEAYRAVFQDYNLKRKQLDKLLNHKEQIRLRVCVVKSEYEKLFARLSENEISPTEVQLQHRQQLLISRYQIALAKRHAAKNISEAFVEILAILRKVRLKIYLHDARMTSM